MPFTGTPDTIRLKGLLKDLLLQNELGGASAYVLSFAKTGKSGYSFGIPQYDLSKNPSARNLLSEILENATSGGNYIVDDGNPATGRSNDTEVLRLYGLAIQPGGISLNNSDKTRINQALGSAYGIQVVDDALDSHLGDLLNKANNVINLTSGPDRIFLESDLGKLFLCDFDNQYGIELPNPPTSQGGALVRFVQGQTVFGIVKQGVLGVDDLLNFYFRTQQAAATPQDPIRRFGHIVETVGYAPVDVQEAKGVLQAYTSFVVPHRNQIQAANAAALNVFMNLVVDPARGGAIGGHTINGEVLVGQDDLGRGDILEGTANGDLIFGEKGADVLRGFEGADVLYGGEGIDTISGGAGEDYLYGDDGGDTLDGGTENDVLEGGQGTDILSGGGGIDLLRGGTEADTLIGGTGDDLLEGGAGFDTYLYTIGDGNDRIEDSDANGVIIVNGKPLAGGVKKTGHTDWISADGTLKYLMSGTDLVVKLNDVMILTVNENFQSGQFNIKLIDAPTVSTQLPTTTRTIVGDFDPLDIDPAEPGIQIDYDELGNFIQDTESPNDRSDLLNGSAGNDTINGEGVRVRSCNQTVSLFLVGVRGSFRCPAIGAWRVTVTASRTPNAWRGGGVSKLRRVDQTDRPRSSAMRQRFSSATREKRVGRKVGRR